MKRLPAIILIAMLTLISTWYVFIQVISPPSNIPSRISISNVILDGQADPPYRYRILKPLTARILQKLMSPVMSDPWVQHVISYSLITLAAFAGVFSLLYLYLRKFFSQNASMIGLLFLQAVIPLSITFNIGIYMEGDFIALAFYMLGLCLMVYGKDIYLPIVIGVATLNREQMVFLAFLYGIYLFSQPQVSGKKLAILTACFAAWFIVFMGVRMYFGFKPSNFTYALHISHNLDMGKLTRKIIPLWLAEVAPSIVLCVLAFSRSNRFFRLSFISLSLYAAMFFFTGNMWELAKFLPAFLVMIPMALQILTGEFVEKI